MQNLFASLQPQNGSQATGSGSGGDSDGDQDGSRAASGVSGASGRGGHGHHGGGISKMEGGLQNLIQQISASSSTATASDATTGSTSSVTATDSSSASLQQSFQNLLTADGASGSNVSLTGFLQALSQNLQGATPSGNVVSTQA